MRRVPKPAA